MIVELVKYFVASVLHILRLNIGWMGWNFFLAVVPLIYSVLLFRRLRSAESGTPSSRLRSRAPIFWWLGILVLITFLLISPFILTDVAYLVDKFWVRGLLWVIVLLLVHMYSLWKLSRASLRVRSHSLVWWLGVLVFVAFLPNAPYVLTDIIHLIQAIRIESSIWLITLVIIPMYVVFLFAGFEAYVLSLINLGYYLKQRGWGSVIWVELLLHGMSAIGIYLGRFLRFNSWDIITQLDTLAESILAGVAGKAPLLIITVTFVLITALYIPFKRVSLAVANYEPAKKNSLGGV